VHLYLTDYRSLYVAHLGGVTDADVREEEEHVPAYYSRQSLSCDCWFQLWDIRRVVLDDTPAVVDELRSLRNTRYHDRPVSLYGGMTDLPLIVTRDDDTRYFDPRTRDQLTGGRHWVEFDAERSGTGGMQRELRENRFGDEGWRALDPATRSFIATAEQLFRTHRNDAAFDLSSVLVDYSKAMEVQVNAILRRALTGSEARLRQTNVDGRTIDVVADGPLTLGQLARAIGGERALSEVLRRRLGHGQWFVSSLPPILSELAAARNPAAHTAAIERAEVLRLRNQLVGVGCTGSLVELSRVRVT
jgi:hypothetical protein